MQRLERGHASRYATFPADADGIVPLTDELWFTDDAATRVREFLLAVWGADTLQENMAWLAESIGTKANETPDETIRRYLADKFFKDHLQTYKKRPIYWLFSSGKQGAFQALVYLHRYTEQVFRSWKETQISRQLHWDASPPVDQSCHPCQLGQLVVRQLN